MGARAGEAAVIRDAGPGDKAGWQELWAAYLAFYEVDLPQQVTEATWQRLMDPASPVKARLVEAEGRVAGFAIHLHHPSTWAATDDCYLEDLFVAPDSRGLGLGRALIDDLVALARAKGWGRLYWHTDQDNAKARALYDSYVLSDGHIRYRMRLRDDAAD
ncbi:MAG: GNAT family N-acetyltransferase [Tabrizicola sp.]|uniref:GNAT family N-acetyltransferase n=1 Tax=Tabrizicola sp. TaxID=2005166 RepID=UPI0027365FB8|nr:GNAT family N-acetyltransferase [Tabrizicola sp.]MDP3264535.1 GNAT family N-acetyltransferase [Tabrizicola sp.]MDP3649485.1 GNAT family N-acetyltransferase [Paracoccaceae bacterium]MDZ4065485.1 GNAT family N-acetyltransferase [Tabrizicola sp.]